MNEISDNQRDILEYLFYHGNKTARQIRRYIDTNKSLDKATLYVIAESKIAGLISSYESGGKILWQITDRGRLYLRKELDLDE